MCHACPTNIKNYILTPDSSRAILHVFKRETRMVHELGHAYGEEWFTDHVCVVGAGMHLVYYHCSNLTLPCRVSWPEYSFPTHSESWKVIGPCDGSCENLVASSLLYDFDNPRGTLREVLKLQEEV